MNIKYLTNRELEVLKYLINGKNNIQIAEELTVSIHTVKAHVSSIIKKLDASDRTQAAVNALKNGLFKF